MCTSGALIGKFLFKNRDLGPQSGLEEDIARGYGAYRYIGVAGHAAPKERGLNSGLNEAGVAAQMTYVGTETLEESITNNVPRGVLIESILRNAANLDEALQIAAGLLNKYHFVGGTITINTLQGAAVIEEAYPRYAIERIGAERTWIVRTNHFENLVLPENFLPREENSKIRNRRLHELLEKLDPAAVSPDDIRRALADHENGENAICRHGGEAQAQTVSTVVYDLQKKQMHYLYGNPCELPFTVYTIE